MVDKQALIIDMTAEERQQIETLAHQRGYSTPMDYVRALIELDATEVNEQAYFWSATWQAGERKADQDIAEGRVKTFDTMHDLIADLA